MTGALERVLRVFLEDPEAKYYGYDLMKAAKLPSGTLYPMLARLQAEGVVGPPEWEAAPDEAGGRPPRRYYRLTGEGARIASLELAKLDAAAPGRPARGPLRPAWGGAG